MQRRGAREYDQQRDLPERESRRHEDDRRAGLPFSATSHGSLYGLRIRTWDLPSSTERSRRSNTCGKYLILQAEYWAIRQVLIRACVSAVLSGVCVRSLT